MSVVVKVQSSGAINFLGETTVARVEEGVATDSVKPIGQFVVSTVGIGRSGGVQLRWLSGWNGTGAAANGDPRFVRALLEFWVVEEAGGTVDAGRKATVTRIVKARASSSMEAVGHVVMGAPLIWRGGSTSGIHGW